jgi:hypothetical protein
MLRLLTFGWFGSDVQEDNTQNHQQDNGNGDDNLVPHSAASSFVSDSLSTDVFNPQFLSVQQSDTNPIQPNYLRQQQSPNSHQPSNSNLGDNGSIAANHFDASQISPTKFSSTTATQSPHQRLHSATVNHSVGEAASAYHSNGFAPIKVSDASESALISSLEADFFRTNQALKQFYNEQINQFKSQMDELTDSNNIKSNNIAGLNENISHLQSIIINQQNELQSIQSLQSQYTLKLKDRLAKFQLILRKKNEQIHELTQCILNNTNQLQAMQFNSSSIDNEFQLSSIQPSNEEIEAQVTMQPAVPEDNTKLFNANNSISYATEQQLEPSTNALTAVSSAAGPLNEQSLFTQAPSQQAVYSNFNSFETQRSPHQFLADPRNIQEAVQFDPSQLTESHQQFQSDFSGAPNNPLEEWNLLAPQPVEQSFIRPQIDSSGYVVNDSTAQFFDNWQQPAQHPSLTTAPTDNSFAAYF